MDGIFELLEGILEIYIGIFTESATKGEMSKGKRRLLTVFLSILLLGILACFIVGIVLLAGGKGGIDFAVGIGLAGVGGVGILAQIIILIVNAKKNKKISEPLNKDDIEYKENDNSLLK